MYEDLDAIGTGDDATGPILEPEPDGSVSMNVGDELIIELGEPISQVGSDEFTLEVSGLDGIIEIEEDPPSLIIESGATTAVNVGMHNLMLYLGDSGGQTLYMI